jgi:anti-sigma factor RsiW
MEEILIAYLDGKATPAEQREVEAHLASCAACRLRADEFRSVSVVLGELPEQEVTPAFDAALRERIAAEDSRRWFDGLLPVPRFAAAAALLLALALWVGTVAPPPQEMAQFPRTDEEFKMIENLQVLEDLDVLSNFEVLSELPRAKGRDAKKL